MYAGFIQFLLIHGLKDKAQSGFPLCLKTEKVVTIHNACSVYGITSDTKEQITTLCAPNAAGDIIPLMHMQV